METATITTALLVQLRAAIDAAPRRHWSIRRWEAHPEFAVALKVHRLPDGCYLVERNYPTMEAKMFGYPLETKLDVRKVVLKCWEHKEIGPRLIEDLQTPAEAFAFDTRLVRIPRAILIDDAGLQFVD